MVKRAKLAAKKSAARGQANGSSGAPPARGGPAPPKHQQRKLSRKVAFLEKLSASRPPAAGSAGVQKKKKRRPSVALNTLPSLAQTLQTAADSKRAAARAEGSSVSTLKARARITGQETARLQQVLKHPQFRANPIAAITTHLAATLPPPPEAPKPKADPREEKRRKRERKKAKAKAAAVDVTMT